MDLLLSILKFSGIIVSGALGILGTVTDTRNKRTGRLNLWGKWALGLTIAGFATALLSEIAQQCKEHQDILDTQARIERQIAVQKVTLNRVERILTRFDTISFSVRYELGTNNGFIKSLHNYAADKIPTALLEKSPGVPTDMGGLTNMTVYSDVVIGWDYGTTFSVRDNGHSVQISLPSNTFKCGGDF
jgi:hypothetical protein